MNTETDFHYTDELMEPYDRACKKGNPDALVAMNDGVFPDYRKNYVREDFVCGEFNDLTVIPKSRFIDGAQAHLLAPLGETWGRPGSRYSGTYLRNFTACVHEAGGVATYDCALYRDGTIDPEQIAALSLCALTNARDILCAMESRHQASFGTPLTIRRLDEAFLEPRVPYRSNDLKYRSDALPSSYLKDDMDLFRRLRPGADRRR